MEFRKHRLDNGLEIIAETNADAHSMSVAFIVRTGSRDGQYCLSSFVGHRFSTVACACYRWVSASAGYWFPLGSRSTVSLAEVGTLCCS